MLSCVRLSAELGRDLERAVEGKNLTVQCEMGLRHSAKQWLTSPRERVAASFLPPRIGTATAQFLSLRIAHSRLVCLCSSRVQNCRSVYEGLLEKIAQIHHLQRLWRGNVGRTSFTSYSSQGFSQLRICVRVFVHWNSDTPNP